MEIIESKDLNFKFTPKCPHCSNELDKIVRLTDDKGFFQRELGYCFCCPHCQKILGFSDYSSS